MTREFLGSFEQLVLAALARLGDDAYGMSVRTEISERTEREIAIGAVYATLERLETKGYACSHSGQGGPEREGKVKRYYEITRAGRDALRDSVRQLNSLVLGLNLGNIT